jgi:hypothetical protein
MQLEELSNISDNLAMMPDPALQQFAQMHKQDPYMVSLALSESNRRKKMRTAAQGQAGSAPQPKVVDAASQGMRPAPAPVMTGSGGTLQTGYGGPVTTGMASGGLPEDQGIAQLPTPNMQRMADGGIAGYEDDEEGMATGGMGGMFNFAQQSEPVVRMSGGGQIPRYNEQGLVRLPNESFANFRRRVFEAELQVEKDRNAEEKALKEAERLQLLANRGESKMVPPSPFFDRTPLAISGETSAPTASAAYDPTENLKKLAQTNARYTTPSEPKNAEEAAMLNRYPATKPAADKEPPTAGGVRDLLPGGNFAPSKAPSIEDATALGDKFFNSKERIGDIKRQVLQEQLDATNAKENSIASLAAFNKKQGPAYAGYEESLKKEELQDATDKEKFGLMALFKGFLAIAAGESPNAATNIAKGSTVGLEEYNVAMKELKKSAKERNKEMQFIGQARRAEERGDYDKVQMYEDKASAANQASARFGIAAINDITNAGGKASADIYNTVLTNTSRENVAAIGERGANARALLPTGDARTAIMLGSGRTEAERLKSGMGVLQELTADKTGMAAFKILGEINAKHANDPMFKPLTLADLTAFQRDYQLNMQAGPKNVSNKPTGKAFD